MPSQLGKLNAVNALFVVPLERKWRESLALGLRILASPPGFETTGQYHRRKTIERTEGHLAMLEDRLSGKLQWGHELGPDAAERYTAMLLDEDRLPLYAAGPLRLTVDLWNPHNEAGHSQSDDGLLAIELIAHRDLVYPWRDGSAGEYAQMADYASHFNNMFTALADALEPLFAFGDIEYVFEPRIWNDTLWPTTCWAPGTLDADRLRALRGLRLTPEEEASLHPLERVAIRPVWRTLMSKAFCLQTRQILGVPPGVPRTADTLLAAHAGLRSPA